MLPRADDAKFTHRTQARAPLAGALILAAFAVAGPATAADTPAQPAKSEGNVETQRVMDGIFGPLSQVLPLSFNDDFAAVKNRPKIHALLEQLVANVGALGKHASRRDRGFEFVAKSLERDVRNVNRWYTLGRYDEARFTLHNLTENCIACHSSLPATKHFPPSDKFFAAVDLDKMPAIERAEMLVVGRQFDSAAKVYEELFTSNEIHPMNLVVVGAFTDYLKLMINVLGDLKRPQAVLKTIADRPSTPLHVAQQVQRWVNSLTVLESKNALAATDLARAKAIFAEGRVLQEFPRDRDGLIQYMVAGAIATRYVHNHPDRGHDVAEAYYLLGQTEALIEHSFWLSRSEFYLESAIRLDPAATFAPKAYALLEESLLNGFSGSSGLNMPDDVKSLLLELKQIITDSQGRDGAKSTKG